MTNRPTTKLVTKSLSGMTDEMVIAELRNNSLWNKAHLKFSPIAMRMEFEAVKEILAVYGFKHE